MNFRHAIAAAVMAGAIVLSGAANAAGPAPVTLQSDVKIERSAIENGTKKVILVPAKRAVPGNRLVFTTSYRNTGAIKIDNFVVTNPVPRGVSYLADPADTGQVSVDGGKSWGQLASLTVATAQDTRRPAQASDVTHIRWIVPVIAPGGSGMVAYHAIVR